MSVRNRDELTAAEVRKLFQEALETELARSVEEFQFGTGTDHEKTITNRFLAWATDKALRSLADPSTVERDQEITVNCDVGAEREAELIENYRAMIGLGATVRSEVEDGNLAALHRLDAPVSERILRQATAHRLRGRLLARQRADFFYHPAIQRHDDHLGALLDEALIISLRGGGEFVESQTPSSSTLIATQPSANDIYLEQDTRRFSEVIDEVCAALQAKNSWNADLSQRKRIMGSFAWITGDKRLCDYRPSDIGKYKMALVNLPTDFRWGEHADKPAAEVLARYDKRPDQNRRSDRTINRDLSTMSKVAGQLALTSWKPTGAVGVIMNFKEHFNAVVEDENEPDRMPWTAKHLEVFFSSPIYVGGGGCAMITSLVFVVDLFAGGCCECFDHIPFSLTEQYGFSLAYVGRAEKWDSAEIVGPLEARDCTITYRRVGRELANIFVHRDLDGLRTEVEFEQRIAIAEVRLPEAAPYSIASGA